MLKQRIKDLQFREEMKQKGRVTESTETQIFKEKLKRCQTSIVQLEKEKLEFKNMVVEKDALILKMKQQISDNKELLKEKDETIKKMKADHAQEIKRIVYKNQVKYSQLSKADQDKLKALEKQQAETYLLIEKQALAELEQKKPPSKTFEEV
jgi:hypothetical protein